jgi:hypothetical protein
VINVSDSTAPTPLTSGQPFAITTYPAAATGNGLLAGSYAFYGTGWTDGTSVQTTYNGIEYIGSFTTDGNGNIIAGELDVNSPSTGLTSYTSLGGIRLPPIVHGAGDHGFAPQLIEIARKKKESGYVGDGLNRWPPCTSATPRVSSAWLWRRDLREEPVRRSPAQVQSRHSLRCGVAACNRGNAPSSAPTHGRAETGSVPVAACLMAEARASSAKIMGCNSRQPTIRRAFRHLDGLQAVAKRMAPGRFTSPVARF